MYSTRGTGRKVNAMTWSGSYWVRQYATPVRISRLLVVSGHLPRAVGRVERQLMLQPRHVWMPTHRDLQICQDGAVCICRVRELETTGYTTEKREVLGLTLDYERLH